MKTTFTRSVVGAVTSLLAVAAAPASAANFGVGIHAGTLGLGVDLGYAVTDSLTARVGFNKFTLSEDFEEDGIDYSADLELESVHALADWHAFGGGFRLTGGLVLNNNAFRGDARVSSGSEVGGQTVTSDGELNLDVEFDDVAPYVGIGWGNLVRGWSKVSFSVDLGVVLQGSPDVSIDDNGSTGVSQSSLRQEEDEVEDELEEFDLYPVLSAAIVFRF